MLKIVEDNVYSSLRCFSGVLGVVDALNSLALVSSLPGFVKPTFESEGIEHKSMQVVGGKHPTMDWLAEQRGSTSVANDVSISQMGGPQNIVNVTDNLFYFSTHILFFHRP